MKKERVITRTISTLAVTVLRTDLTPLKSGNAPETRQEVVDIRADLKPVEVLPYIRETLDTPELITVSVISSTVYDTLYEMDECDFIKYGRVSTARKIGE